jgi:hypothetical protein
LFLEDRKGRSIRSVEERRRLIHRADAAQFFGSRDGHYDVAGVPNRPDDDGPQPERQHNDAREEDRRVTAEDSR